MNVDSAIFQVVGEIIALGGGYLLLKWQDKKEQERFLKKINLYNQLAKQNFYDSIRFSLVQHGPEQHEEVRPLQHVHDPLFPRDHRNGS